MHLRERNYNKEVIVISLLKCKLKCIAKTERKALNRIAVEIMASEQ